MNEHTVLKNSIKMCILGMLLFFIVGIITKDISYAIGFLLGYGISVLTFLLIIQSSTFMLSLKSNSTPIILVLFIIKLLLYAFGFLLAVKMPKVFNIVGVLIGYFVIKITIYLETYKHKGGEEDG